MNMAEFHIKRLYCSINIYDPYQLSIENIANKLNITIHYWEFTSAIAESNGRYRMFINEYLNKQQQWMDFGHEMKHFYCDKENQIYLKEQYVDYMETKADYFAYHFCIPTFMLQELKGVTAYDVMNLFNVEFAFALKRMEMYKNSLIGGCKRWPRDMLDIVGEVSGSWK